MVVRMEWNKKMENYANIQSISVVLHCAISIYTIQNNLSYYMHTNISAVVQCLRNEYINIYGSLKYCIVKWESYVLTVAKMLVNFDFYA